MKKFFKVFFLILLVAIISFTAIFNKRILLAYRIVDKYVLSKDSVLTSQEFNSNKALSSMNYKDVVYKNTNNIQLALDIYGPTRQVYKSSPVLLYVHGGSFAYGDKSIPDALSPLLDTFRSQGYTIISTSYELMKNKESFNKQISDVKDTIRWLYKNNSTYNIDTNEIGVIGISSGAYLSLMASYSGEDEFTDDSDLSKYPSKIKYLIDFAGPTDLSLLNTKDLNYDLSKIFKSIKNKDDLTKKYNPIDYVTPKIPNTLIIHSDSDAIVPYESSKELYDKCNQVHAKAKLITLNSSGHDLSTISNDDITSMSKGLATFVVFNSPL
jgi:acetyl esterase/lipase